MSVHPTGQKPYYYSFNPSSGKFTQHDKKSDVRSFFSWLFRIPVALQELQKIEKYLQQNPNRTLDDTPKEIRDRYRKAHFTDPVESANMQKIEQVYQSIQKTIIERRNRQSTERGTYL